METRDKNGFGQTKLYRHPIDKIDVFEITEKELEDLGNNNSDLFLEFGIFSGSVCVSFVCSLFAINKENSPTIFYIFFIICIVTGLFFIFLIILWYRNKGNRKEIIMTVKDRPSIMEK